MSNLSPGTVVTVTGVGRYENGIVGYVCRTLPTNGDDLYVGVISQPGSPDDFFRLKPGQRLSYSRESLVPPPR